MMPTNLSHISLPIFDTGSYYTCYIKYFLFVFMSTETESFKVSFFLVESFSFVVLISGLKRYKIHDSLLLTDQKHSHCFILGDIDKRISCTSADKLFKTECYILCFSACEKAESTNRECFRNSTY